MENIKLTKDKAYKLVNYFLDELEKEHTQEELTEYTKEGLIAEICMSLEESFGLSGKEVFKLYNEKITEMATGNMEKL